MGFRNWADLTSTDILRTDTTRAIAVLPMGAIEQHGPHLPLSTDIDLATGVLARAATMADSTKRTHEITRARAEPDVLVLPPMALGRSIEHQNFRGTLSLSAQTVMATVFEVGAAVANAGVRRLVLFNGHGGNVPILDIMARDLRAEFEMLTAYTSWYQLNGQEELVDKDELRHGVHGGLVETSAMLSLRPDLVQMDQARMHPSQGQDWAERYQMVGVGGTPVKLGWLAEDLSPTGVVGDAGSASVELGEKLVNRSAEGFLQFLDEFIDMDLPENLPG